MLERLFQTSALFSGKNLDYSDTLLGFSDRAYNPAKTIPNLMGTAFSAWIFSPINLTVCL